MAMTILEVKQKIAEAENWLKCDCALCQAMRSAASKKTIENYIAKLKAKLIN
jgi:hypothetical protein